MIIERPNSDSTVISGTFIRLLLEYLASQGIEGHALLGINHDDPVAATYPLQQWDYFLDSAATQLNDPLLGLHLGRSITMGHLGVLGYVLHSCGNIGGALLRFQRYERLFYDMDPLRHEIKGDQLVLSWSRQTGPGGALAEDCLTSSLIRCTRDLCGQEISPSGVCLTHPAPADPASYHAYFGTTVQFNQPRTVLRLPLSVLSTPLLRPDAALLALLEQQAETLLAKLPDRGNYEHAIRRCIIQLLREGDPSLERVAEKMNTSPRTLRRRLEEKDQNFRAILEDTRCRLAEEYLSDPRLQLSEIAALLGYAEQSPFQRAFRRWKGQTPQGWRNQLQQ